MKVVILAGGGGSRLFPLSRTCYPKQFLKIAGEKSLLQQTIERFLGIVNEEDILIVTNKDYVFHVKEDLQEINVEKIKIITEPVGKNTAPAIGLAISYCTDILKYSENEMIFVTPADHLITPIKQFQNIIKRAAMLCASTNNIVTLGIEATAPETGYGYIEIDDCKIADGYKVKSFTEKPDVKTAENYIKSGKYYWNSGMFLFSIKTILNEMKINIPDITNIIENGFEYCKNNFVAMPDISIDYAVAEKSKNILVVPLNEIKWSDVGSFDAISEILRNKKGNAFYGDVVTENCKNTMILGDKRLISAIDVKDLLIVDTPDALLVAKKGSSQKVKKLVKKLKMQNRTEVTDNITIYRPWGSYTILAEGDCYKVKLITINPGEKLSLQMHYHRSEHWTVINGTGKLTLDDKVIFFKENESTYIPVATRHRLENPGHVPLSIIEVQNGRYLGEDDIVRFDDVYGRIE